MKGKKFSGMLTVEASVLMPFLFVITVTFIFIVIYAYDRALMAQDINALIASDQSSTENYIRTYDEITKTHPYMALKDLKVERTKRGNGVLYKISGTWNNPVWPGMSRLILYEKEIKEHDIYLIMITSDLLFMNKEEKNDFN